MSKFHSRLQAVVFFGFAPNVINGYFVMRQDGKVELTSTITEETIFDEPEPALAYDQQPGQTLKDISIEEGDEKTDQERMEGAVMGFAGGEGWYWNGGEDKVWNTMPQDDP